ncbi:hypothetical protein ILUMI_12208 [Ignelater luminosus]|uniref:Securin n=1 Tax=Ignelater luminosus TaxID=2038154 RepID=A0A8K0CUK1_IGNLU|nr:hypothetical protein ILUMI_12208 [Ignelater luminosus]
MFSTPTFRPFNRQENKDSLVTRKPGISNSARKPLGDRSNKDAYQNEMKSLKAPLGELKISNKETSKTASVKKPSPITNNYPDWYADICSFKETEDSYEDIIPKSQRFNKFDFMSIVKPRTPSPTRIEIDPMLLELPETSFFKFQDSPNLEKIQVEDVDLPDFDAFEGMPF